MSKDSNCRKREVLLFYKNDQTPILTYTKKWAYAINHLFWEWKQYQNFYTWEKQSNLSMTWVTSLLMHSRVRGVISQGWQGLSCWIYFIKINLPLNWAACLGARLPLVGLPKPNKYKYDNITYVLRTCKHWRGKRMKNKTHLVATR